MNEMLKSIMNQMDCTLEDAKIILDNILNNSNIVKTAITNTIKKEYDL